MNFSILVLIKLCWVLLILFPRTAVLALCGCTFPPARSIIYFPFFVKSFNPTSYTKTPAATALLAIIASSCLQSGLPNSFLYGCAWLCVRAVCACACVCVLTVCVCGVCCVCEMEHLFVVGSPDTVVVKATDGGKRRGLGSHPFPNLAQVPC